MGVGLLRGLLVLALVGTAGPSCGGLCRDLVDGYDAALREEAAWVGAGTAAPADPELHVGLTLSPGLLQRVLAPVNAALPTIDSRATVGTGGRRSVVMLSAQPVLEGLVPLEAERQEVRLSVGIEAQVAVRRPGSRADHFLHGSAEVDGHLVLERDPSGDIVLAITFDSLLTEAQVATYGLEPEVAAALENFVEPGIPRLLLEDVQRVALLRFSQIRAGPLPIRLAPAAISLAPDTGALFLGFVTNLRPERGGGVQAAIDPPEAGLRYSLHPGLLEAAVRLAVADGLLPRTYDESANPDQNGTAHVVLRRFRFDENGFELVFRVWDLLSGACWTGQLLTAGYAELRDGQIALVTNRVAPLPLDEGEGGTDVDTAAWAHFALTEQAMSLAESVIGLHALVLGDGETLDLTPGRLELMADRIEVDLAPTQSSWSRAGGSPSPRRAQPAARRPGPSAAPPQAGRSSMGCDPPPGGRPPAGIEWPFQPGDVADRRRTS